MKKTSEMRERRILKDREAEELVETMRVIIDDLCNHVETFAGNVESGRLNSKYVERIAKAYMHMGEAADTLEDAKEFLEKVEKLNGVKTMKAKDYYESDPELISELCTFNEQGPVKQWMADAIHNAILVDNVSLDWDDLAKYVREVISTAANDASSLMCILDFELWENFQDVAYDLDIKISDQAFNEALTEWKKVS